MQQMWYTLHLRDSGAGMGAHIPKIRGLRHAGEEEAMPSRGFMFDTDDPAEMAKWKGWRRWVTFDALLLFWGITMLVTISFTVLAQAGGAGEPGRARALIEGGDREAALNAMSDAFASAGSPVLGARVLRLHRADRAERHARPVRLVLPRPGGHDVPLRHGRQEVLRCRSLYAGFLWGVIIFGILILLFGPADGPSGILDTLAFLSTFAMGAYCVVLLLVNNRMLPKPIRPRIWYAT